MKTLHYLAAAVVAISSVRAAEMSAEALAGQLADLQQDGSAYVRLKLDSRSSAAGTGSSMQLQIKQRRSANSVELVYQVLWPKEAAGEGVLLKRSGSNASGALVGPGGKVTKLGNSDMKKPLFGSALTYGDVLENFFAWQNQKLTGSESIERVFCQILESRPGKGDFSTAAVVRSWIDSRRMVPMRVEKFDSAGKPISRVETKQVVRDDKGRNIPAFLSIQNFKTGTFTELDGSKLKHGVSYQDGEFTAEGLSDMKVPSSR